MNKLLKIFLPIFALSSCDPSKIPTVTESTSAFTSSKTIEVSSQPIQQKKEIRIGTWNTKRLGQSKTKDLKLFSKVINDSFDVVSLVEVMNQEGFFNLLKELGPEWSGETTQRAVGDNGYFEFYGVVYRKNIVNLKSYEVVLDPRDLWVREPGNFCFSGSSIDFCLISIHIIYGNRVGPRDAEISELGNLSQQLITGKEKDYIFLGDFNRSGKTPGFQSFFRNGYLLTQGGQLNTTLGRTMYANPYDHILLNRAYTSEWSGKTIVVDMVSTYCEGNFSLCNSKLSDHIPIGIILDDIVDDD